VVCPLIACWFRELPKQAVHASVLSDVLPDVRGPDASSIFEPALPGSNADSTAVVACACREAADGFDKDYI
jgi:hypothetical protein